MRPNFPNRTLLLHGMAKTFGASAMKTRDKKAVLKPVLAVLLLVTALFAIARTSQSYSEQLPLRQQSKYFDFRFKRHPEKIKAITRFADAFIDIVNRDFFKAEFDYPIRVLVTEDFATHRTLVSEQFGVTDPTMGIFLYKYNLFATYEDSGLGTFAHEIMHPLVDRNLKDRPEWAIEGIPTFFEKFYGYWRGDELIVNWGFQNPWRIKQLGTDLARLDLPGILATTRAEEQESEQRLVSIFLWEQGKFKQFLDLIKNREKNDYDSYFEAAMGMPIVRVIPLWQDYLARIAARRSEILRLPLSAALPDQAAFHRFAASYGISIASE
jgi:hypothetical protein